MSPHYSIFEQQVICCFSVTLDQRCNIVLVLSALGQQKVVMVDRCLCPITPSKVILEFVPQILFAAGTSVAALRPVNSEVVPSVAVLASLMELLGASFKLLLSLFGARPNLPLELPVERCALRIVDVVGVRVYFTLHQISWGRLWLLHKKDQV